MRFCRELYYKYAIVIALVFVDAGPVVAADSYECTVLEAWRLKDDGTLKSADDLQGFKVGRSFVIDRGTGRIIGGGGLQNHGIGGEPEILHHGDEQNSFRVITVFGPLNPVGVIEVRVWISRTNPPFIYYDQGDVFSGQCAVV